MLDVCAYLQILHSALAARPFCDLVRKEEHHRAYVMQLNVKKQFRLRIIRIQLQVL